MRCASNYLLSSGLTTYFRRLLTLLNLPFDLQALSSSGTRFAEVGKKIKVGA